MGEHVYQNENLVVCTRRSNFCLLCKNICHQFCLTRSENGDFFPTQFLASFIKLKYHGRVTVGTSGKKQAVYLKCQSDEVIYLIILSRYNHEGSQESKNFRKS